MRYPYYCSQCDIETEVIKPLADIDMIEHCECGHAMARKISEKISFKNEKVSENQTFYHPALGRMVNSNAHAQKIAKEKGFVEVGNDTQDCLQPEDKSYDLSHREFHDVFGVGELRGG